MARPTYIQVILPLRLEWEPYYSVPEGIHVEVGDRVRVPMVNASYIGTVSAVHVKPEIKEESILPIIALEDSLPRILVLLHG